MFFSVRGNWPFPMGRKINGPFSFLEWPVFESGLEGAEFLVASFVLHGSPSRRGILNNGLR